MNNELLISIRDSIKSIISGEISLPEAEEIYRESQETCERLEQNSHPENDSFSGWLLYSHNISNFAKLTAILKKTDDVFTKLEYAGSSELLSAAERILRKKKDIIIGSHFCQFRTSDIKGMRHKFFFSHLKIEANEYVIASAVSAVYADTKKFMEIAQLIGLHIAETDANNDSVDYYGEMKKHIGNILKNSLDSGKKMKASLFVIDKAMERFNETEICTIADEIYDKLKTAYGKQSLIVVITYNVYLALSLQDVYISSGTDLSFNYDGFLLKNSKYDFNLSALGDLNKVWAEINKRT
ncbi:MAG: hypothetical protein LBT84_01550 [Spirochaetia bacterium]|jgi:hypothetical protein|nr:hypothetical protein [Spirochaetia bacterium]